MKFQTLHNVEAKTIPGTEEWERMYRLHQYQFVTDATERNQYDVPGMVSRGLATKIIRNAMVIRVDDSTGAIDITH